MKNSNEWTVTEPCTLLPFLLERAKGSRNNIKSLLARRMVLVNGKSVTQFDYALTPGQQVSLAPVQAKEVPKLPFDIIYEDEDLIAIDKPAGLLTIATEKEKTATAYHMLTEYVHILTGGRIFIVHRLDRETSGVVLFAKSQRAKRALQDDWDKLVRRRGYLAVIEGSPKEAQGTVRSWLRETSTHLVYSTNYAGGGKESVTHYNVLTTSGEYSLVDVTIDTGRKNQIRVHMQDLGHPVAGDKKYGAASNPLNRLCLHAYELLLNNPLTKQPLRLSAPVPKGFKKLSPPAGEGFGKQ